MRKTLCRRLRWLGDPASRAVGGRSLGRVTVRRGMARSAAEIARYAVLGAAAALLAAWTLPLPAHAAGAAAAPAPTTAAAVRDFEFPSLNRTYRMDGATMAPVQQGPLTIYLTSPRNALIVRGHTLELQPLGDGTYRGRMTVDLLGSGDLVARIDTGNGGGDPMKDTVVLPRQTVEVSGRVRFHRVPEGWEVTALALPEETEVTIQSRVINSLVTMCEQLAAFLGLDCGGVGHSLTHVAVPLPPPGTVFLLQASDLTADEVDLLDGYLGTSPGTGDSAGIP